MRHASPAAKTEGMLKSLVRYGYVPLMLLGINGAAIALAQVPWAELWMAALILAAIALSFAAERAVPYTAEWNDSLGDGRRDVAHAFINETALLLTVLVIPVMAALTPFHHWWPSSTPFIVQVLIAGAGHRSRGDAGSPGQSQGGLVVALPRGAPQRQTVLRLQRADEAPAARSARISSRDDTFAHHGHAEVSRRSADRVHRGATAAATLQRRLPHRPVAHGARAQRRAPLPPPQMGWHRRRQLRAVHLDLGPRVRTFSFDPQRRFRTDDLGMAAKPNYPTEYLAQLAEPFRASGGRQFDDIADTKPVSLDEARR